MAAPRYRLAVRVMQHGAAIGEFIVRHLKRIVKFALVFASLLLFSSCSSRDTKLCEQITGTWTRDDTFEMTLAADGSFVSQWVLPTSKLTYQGTWKVKDGGMVSTITNCFVQGTTNFEAVGTSRQFMIVRADRTELVWSNDGLTISLKRK